MVHPDFLIEPIFCPICYTYEITPLVDAARTSAITVNAEEKKFTFFYVEDLKPLEQVQTTIIKAKSCSLFPE